MYNFNLTVSSTNLIYILYTLSLQSVDSNIHIKHVFMNSLTVAPKTFAHYVPEWRKYTDVRSVEILITWNWV